MNMHAPLSELFSCGDFGRDPQRQKRANTAASFDAAAIRSHLVGFMRNGVSSGTFKFHSEKSSCYFRKVFV